MLPSGQTPTREGSLRIASPPAGLLAGRILTPVGLVCALTGLYLVSIAMESLGIVLGFAAMIFGLPTQGYPGGPGS